MMQTTRLPYKECKDSESVYGYCINKRTHTAHRQKAKVMILLLLFALFLQSGQGQNNECILEYHEEPPRELDCKPFTKDNKWNLRVSCEVRARVNDELAPHYEVQWFHRNMNNTVTELETSEVQKSKIVERTIFGRTWFVRNFTDEVIGDIWCQPVLMNDINATLSKSQILTIRERNYYQNLSFCSGLKFLRNTRCISVLQSSTTTSSFISESIVKNTQYLNVITEYIATTTTIVENCPSTSTFQQKSSQEEKLFITLIAIGSCIMVLLIILIIVLIIIIIQRKRSKDIHPRTTERVRQELPLTNNNNDDTITSLHTNFERLATTETGRAPPTIAHHYSTISDNVYVQTSTDINRVSDASQHCYSSVHTNTQNENTMIIPGDSDIPIGEYNKLNHDNNSGDTTLPRAMDIYSSLEVSQESPYNHVQTSTDINRVSDASQHCYSSVHTNTQNENTTIIPDDSAISTGEYNKLNHDENSGDTTLPRAMDIYSSLEVSQESPYNHIERTSGPKGPHLQHQNEYSTLRKQEQS